MYMIIMLYYFAGNVPSPPYDYRLICDANMWVDSHVLKNYAEDIKNGFAVRLLADYNSFKKNKDRYSV